MLGTLWTLPCLVGTVLMPVRDPRFSWSKRDAKGLRVKVVTEETLNGVLLDRGVDLTTFDTFGRQIQSEFSRDRDGDLDAADSIETFPEQYDNRDRVVVSTDRIAEGTRALLFSSGTASAYGKNTTVETDDVDDDGDGTVGRHVVTVIPV
jgi:hypothetical protein